MPYRDPERRREAARDGSRAHYARYRAQVIARTAARKARQKQLRKDWAMSIPQRCPKCQGSMTREEHGGRQWWQCERESCGGRILLDRPHVPAGFTPQALPVEPEKRSRRRLPVVQDDAPELDESPLTDLEDALLGDEIPQESEDDAIQDPDAPDPPTARAAPLGDDQAPAGPTAQATAPAPVLAPSRAPRDRGRDTPLSRRAILDPQAQALAALDEAIGHLDQETVVLQARLAANETERAALVQARTILQRRP